jgi:tetratricopeptide (TPR) repeat protein
MDKKSNRKSTRTLILVMMVLVVIAILIARSYYSGVNAGVDPRIKTARLAYKTYNQLASQSDFEGVLKTLDTINLIYSEHDHYKESYEMTVGLHIDSLRVNHKLGFMQNLTKKGLLDLAEEELNQGISIYQQWDSIYATLTPDEIKSRITQEFYTGLNGYTADEKTKFLNTRVKEIETAQWENERRLSVAYTNLGTIYFHRDNYEKAAELYDKALMLWEDNLNAENNLNSMLGRPLKKRNFIQKLFPKERKKD